MSDRVKHPSLTSTDSTTSSYTSMTTDSSSVTSHTESKRQRPLNNIGLNCTGPLIRDIFNNYTGNLWRWPHEREAVVWTTHTWRKAVGLPLRHQCVNGTPGHEQSFSSTYPDDRCPGLVTRNVCSVTSCKTVLIQVLTRVTW